jgi:hypothetical protein
MQTTPSGTGYAYTGPLAVAAFGGPVPLSDATSPGSYPHTDIETGPGSLMFPYMDVGVRQTVTTVEIAILADANVPVKATCLDAGSDFTADADQDGAPDCADNCLDLANADQADRDADGQGDACDACPDDPEKSSDQGLCGCGLAEGDADGDGEPDCFDGCPDDAEKTDPGECGCGQSETDSDADGTPDCNDRCPDDPIKQAPGICGCGVPDEDTDGDGIVDCSPPDEDGSDEYLEVDEVDEEDGGANVDPQPRGDAGGGTAVQSAGCGLGMLTCAPLMLAAMVFVKLSRRPSAP